VISMPDDESVIVYDPDAWDPVEPNYVSVFCPICRAQVFGADVNEVLVDLFAHISGYHGL
jgi:hypothetical protein